MAGHELNVVAQRPQLGDDGLKQGLGVAARKVGTPDRSRKQHVSDLGEPGLTIEEDHVSGGVTRAVIDLPRRFPSVTLSPLASHRLGVKGRASGTP